MDFGQILKSRSLFRFTGPPEHWLTAVKYMTWGLENKYKDQWAKIRPGDIFFIHSTQNSEFKNAKSGIIGLGVVGPDFSIKKAPLWFYETLHKVNKWPLLVPLSEIYLFSELPPPSTWENPSQNNVGRIKELIDILLQNYIPLAQIRGFPQMGSFSSVSSEVARQILLDKRPLYLYSDGEGTYAEPEAILKAEHEEGYHRMDKVESATEALRYADTLRLVESVKMRVLREPTSQYLRDNELLERANSVHQSILQQLIDLFKKRGYETRAGRLVDLFAYNKHRSFLFEVKSTENKNFRPQARKSIAQLLEYDYFDVQKFAQDNSLTFDEKHKLIVPSKSPIDPGYVEFLNSLKIGIALVGKDTLKPVGQDFGFSKL